MSEREEIDSLLLEYLRAEKNDPVRAQVRHVADWAMTHDKEDRERHREVLLAVQSHHYRISNLERSTTKVEEWADTTGKHELATIRAANKRWTDAVWKIAIGVVALLLGAGVMAVIRGAHQ